MHGVSINPIAFLVVVDENVRVIPVNYTSAIDKLIEYVPDLMEKANCILNKKMDKMNEKCNHDNNEETDTKKIKKVKKSKMDESLFEDDE